MMDDTSATVEATKTFIKLMPNEDDAALSLLLELDDDVEDAVWAMLLGTSPLTKSAPHWFWATFVNSPFTREGKSCLTVEKMAFWQLEQITSLGKLASADTFEVKPMILLMLKVLPVALSIALRSSFTQSLFESLL
jgi:hypothetical protein